MLRLTRISDRSFSTLLKDENKDIKDSKHSPVYRKRGAEGFSPLFSFISVYLNKIEGHMKLFIKILTLVIGLFYFGNRAHAQVKGIIGYANFDQDNAIMGDSTNLDVFVKFVSATTNADTTVFGDVFFRYQTNWMWDYNHDWHKKLDNNPGWETLGPGFNHFLLRIFCDTNQNVMRTGPVNVIIIWPAFTNPSNPLIDSLDYFLFNVNVWQAAGLQEQPYESFGTSVYPNPAGAMQVVYINAKYSSQIQQISISNAMGQVMARKEFADGENSNGYVLPTDDLRSGMYNIQIFYKDKKTEVVKFIKN